MKNIVTRRILGCALAAALALTAGACAKSGAVTAQTAAEEAAAWSTGDEEENSPQLPNPWTEYDTLEEAEKAAGFSVDVPAAQEGYAQAAYRVMDGILEVETQDAEGNRLILRKGDRAKMGKEKDISGDCNSYSEAVTRDISGKRMEERGDHGLVSTVEEEACLSSLSEAVGFSVKTLTELPFAVSDTAYTCYSGGPAQITWTGTGGETCTFRMAQGTGDISEDYNDYAGEKVTLSGAGDGTYALARWTDGTMHTRSASCVFYGLGEAGPAVTEQKRHRDTDASFWESLGFTEVL